MEIETEAIPSKSMLKLGLSIASGLSLIILILFGIFFYQISVPRNKSDKQIIYEVKKGESISQVASGLQQAGMISSALAFEIYVKLGPAHGKLIPGPYGVGSSMNIRAISRQMSAGQLAIAKLSIPEGYTIRKIAKLWEANDLGSADDFVKATKESYPYPFIVDGSLEGYLFPATYEVKLNSSPRDFITMMLDAFASKAQPLISSTDTTTLKPSEVVALASIVEHEGKTEADRKLIAGVFLNRLARGMKLQSDVTINYVTGKSATTASDLKIDSPYNSYLYKGLPPTPISNPGVESINAVLNPTKSDYLFFLAGKEGKVYYAKTLSDHEQNIKAYLQ